MCTILTLYQRLISNKKSRYILELKQVEYGKYIYDMTMLNLDYSGEHLKKI